LSSYYSSSITSSLFSDQALLLPCINTSICLAEPWLKNCLYTERGTGFS
jgi:hypothetical protein